MRLHPSRRAWPGLLGVLAGSFLAAACGASALVPVELATPSTQTLTVAADRGVVPIALRIPSIRVNTSDTWQMLGIQGQRGVPVTSTKGEIEVPPVKQPMKLGLFCPTWGDSGPPKSCGAPVPGALGPSVVVGHINGGGKDGVFAHLAELKPGALIEIDRSDHKRLTFEVTEVQVIPKARFPTQRVWGDVDHAALRLITCGPGQLDRKAGNYLEQTIIYAVLRKEGA